MVESLSPVVEPLSPNVEFLSHMVEGLSLWSSRSLDEMQDLCRISIRSYRCRWNHVIFNPGTYFVVSFMVLNFGGILNNYEVSAP